MFNEIYEDNEKVYQVPIEKFGFDKDIELYLKLNDVYTVEGFLKYNSTTFKNTFGIYTKEINQKLKKFGYRLTNGNWEKDGRILVDQNSRNSGLLI